MRAVAALATIDPAHQHEHTRIVVERPTRCGWCVRRMFRQAVATLIDGTVLHASCATLFREFEPEDTTGENTDVLRAPTPEPSPCP
jgi:hypothetical protein